MCTLASLPHLSGLDFEAACSALSERFQRHGYKQNAWLSVEPMHNSGTSYLIIRANLHSVPVAANDSGDEFEEDDPETLITPTQPQTLIVYDILLSPIYRVPVLYFKLSDPQHRFPQTMATLYEHVIPAQYRAQTEHVGVIGGITIAVRLLWHTEVMALMQAGPPTYQQPRLLRSSVSNSRRHGSLHRMAPCEC
jgi:ubiquitin-like-conjugating enzyme ATG10